MTTATPAASVWRWVDTGAVPGPMAMAIDEALLRSYSACPQLPVFRFYGWSRPTISLGRFQRADDDIDPDACAAAGVPLIRRITGGGAIYHDHEVTYSLVCSRSDLGKMTVKESYRKICSFLILTYQRLGIDAGFAVDRVSDGSKLGTRTAHCFAGREAYDIVVRDGGSETGGGTGAQPVYAKLGGNAQRRLGDIVFQHGSIPLTLQLPQQRGLFAELPDAAGVTALYPALGCSETELPPGTIGARLRAAFAEVMGITWYDQPLTAAETADAEVLQQRKYTADVWNAGGKDPLSG